mgnify:CR=1 FL=1
MPVVHLRKTKGVYDWIRLYRLYREAFPASERKPFAIIARMYRQRKTDLWCVTRDGSFAGMAATINGEDLILLDYFAVVKSLRGQGVGSEAMGLLQEQYRDRGLFVEIESTRSAVPDLHQRQKRKQFYLDAGMKDLGTEANVFGVNMELLGSRCELDYDGYRAFYRDHYSGWAADHLEEVK